MRRGVISASIRKDVRAVVAFLAELGATDVDVTQKHSLRVTWRAGGRPLAIRLAISPCSFEASVRAALGQIRRRYREIGV